MASEGAPKHGTEDAFELCPASWQSTVTGVLAVHGATFRPGTLCLLVSPTQRQSAELFARCTTIMKTLKNPPVLIADNLTSCTFTSGSRIISLPGDADNIRGFTPDLVLVDECGYISDEVFLALRPSLSVSKGRLLMMGTPHGRRGAMWHASIDTTEGWEKILVTAAECPRISKEFLDAERATVGYAFAQEYEGQYLDAASQLFSGQDIADAITPRSDLPLRLPNGVKPRPSGRQPLPVSEDELVGELVSYSVALDLGQSRDRSALVCSEIRHEIERTTDYAWVPGTVNSWETKLASVSERIIPHCHVVYLSRFILGTPYPLVVDDVVDVLLNQLSPEVPFTFHMDSTGVGRGILEMFEQRGIKPYGVTLTAGHEVNTEGGRRDHRIPKNRLIGALQLMLATKRLKIAANIAALPTWTNEMESFTARISTTGRSRPKP